MEKKIKSMRRICEVKKSSERCKKENILLWYDHVERVTDDRLVQRKYSNALEDTWRISGPKKKDEQIQLER